MPAETNNPVAQRLIRLRSLYEEFREKRGARILLWQLENDEIPMVDQFYHTETTNFGQTPDFFLKLETPFVSPASYAKNVLTELSQQVREHNETTDPKPIPINWSVSQPPAGTDPFLHNLAAFGQSIEGLEGYVVAYLFPTEIQDFSRFEKWLEGLLQQPWPANVRLMVLDAADEPVLPRLPQTYPEQTVAIQPKLDMPQAMKEVAAAAGSGDNPGTKFQIAFIDLSQAIGAHNMEKAVQLGNRAESIAAENDWIHLQVAVHIALGSGWMSTKNYEKADEAFDTAHRLAESAVTRGEAAGYPLASTALFSKGGALLAQKKYEAALQVYRQTVPVTEAGKEPFKMMEAWRMVGHCNEQLKKWPDAYEAYRHALDVAGELAPEIRANSTLPYTGAALLRIHDYELGSKPKQRQEIEEKMVAWVGPDWQKSVSKNPN